MSHRFAGQVAIVTGGTAGIGFATATEIVAEGGRVVVCGRNGERAAKTVSELGADVARAVVGDITDPATVAKVVSAAADGWGRLDVLVNNAGGGTGVRSIDDIDADDLRRCFSLNLDAVVATIRACVPSMRRTGGGRIVNVTSVAGRDVGRISGPQYAAAKAAVHGLTRHLSVDLAADGILVNAVAPGFVATDRAAAMFAGLSEAERDAIIGSTPLARAGTPREIARAVAFMASTDASFITGATLDVNGGSYRP